MLQLDLSSPNLLGMASLGYNPGQIYRSDEGESLQCPITMKDNMECLSGQLVGYQTICSYTA